jgi:hypothetical protein
MPCRTQQQQLQGSAFEIEHRQQQEVQGSE